VYQYEEDVRKGEQRRFHSNGNLAAIEIVSGNIMIGTASYFDDTGRLSSEVPYERGAVHGTLTTYYPNGELSSELPYVAGQKEGMSRRYWENGYMSYQTLWRRDRRIHQKNYDQNGHQLGEQRYE
jgi:antitoxin component YwqK of YwqJK toxin-antitoxin module